MPASRFISVSGENIMNRKQLLNSTFVGCGKLKVPSRRMFFKTTVCQRNIAEICTAAGTCGREKMILVA